MNDLATPAWVTDLLGPGAAVVAIVGGGTSRDTVLVETPARGRVVARHDRGAGPLSGTPFTLAREAATYAAVTSAGIPVAALVAVAPGGDAFAVEEVPGRPARAADAIDDYLTVLGRLHRTGQAHVPAGVRGFDAAGKEDLALWEAIAGDRLRRPTPLLAAAFDTLRRHADPAGPVVLCHGDAGAGNYLYEGDRVTGLVDWEMAHTGDPHDDLASIAARAVLAGVDLGDFAGRVRATWVPSSGFAFDPQRHLVAVAAVLARMVTSCLCALDHAELGTDRTVQLLGLPLMEVHLVRALATLDGVALPPLADDDVAPDLAYAAELLRAVTEALADVDVDVDVEAGGRGRPGHRRRLAYLGRQVGLALEASAPSPTEPGRPGDLRSLWSAALGRLATVPESRPIAFAPVAGVAR